jgi:hypothetical protein
MISPVIYLKEKRKRNNMKKCFLLFVCTVMLIIPLITSCAADDDQSIKDSVTGFFTAYQSESYSQCLKFLSQRLRTSESETAIIDKLQSGRVFIESLNSIGIPEITDKSAMIWVDVIVGNGMMERQAMKLQIFLIKEGSGWKIDRLDWIDH